MTMLKTEQVTPDEHDAIAEAEHIRLLDVTGTARVIARSALRVAHSDVMKAWTLIQDQSGASVDELLEVLAEAREQLEYTGNMLRGRVWELRL